MQRRSSPVFQIHHTFCLCQGERGVPGVPGDHGEKGEPGESIIVSMVLY